MNEFDQWLIFSKRERIGILVFALCILAFNLVSRFSNAENIPASSLDPQLISKMDALFVEEEQSEKEKGKSAPKTFKKKFKQTKADNSSSITSTKITPATPRDSTTSINPNAAELLEMTNIGIPKRVAHTIINFRNKGGRFKKTEDLKMIYGLTDETYALVANQVSIPQSKASSYASPTTQPKQYSKPKIEAIKPVDINTASEAELQEIRGIGPFFSKNIVERRELLSGYYTVDQLIDIPKMTDSTLINLKPHLFVTGEIVKQNINQVKPTVLERHPYIQKSLAKKIMTHRDFNNKFNSWEEFQSILKITPKQLQNIQAYFTIE